MTFTKQYVETESEDHDIKTKWENLANAVILQACDEYKTGYALLYSRYGKAIPKEEIVRTDMRCTAIDMFYKAEYFFNSDDFHLFTNVNPVSIIEELKRQAMDEVDRGATYYYHRKRT